jgi:putative ABC transport system substrate-binding protein
MRRREFIGFVIGTAVWPLVARAQKSGTPKVGYVWIGERSRDVGGAGLRQGLVDKGYEIGRNLTFEDRYAYGDIEKVPALIAELLALRVDVLVTVGTAISLEARRATSTVPIVCISGDPVGTGLVASLSRPGGNVTGLSLLAADYSAKWLELLKEALPKLQRVAVLWNSDNPSIILEMERLKATARALGLDLTSFSAKPNDIEVSLAAIANGGFDGIVVTTDASIEPSTPRIIAWAAEHRLPTIYPFSTAVQQGGLMSYSADFFELWRLGASYVDRILKGEKPADLPIEQPTAVTLKINLKTAKALDLTVPATLLARADTVIE